MDEELTRKAERIAPVKAIPIIGNSDRMSGFRCEEKLSPEEGVDDIVVARNGSTYEHTERCGNKKYVASNEKVLTHLLLERGRARRTDGASDRHVMTSSKMVEVISPNRYLGT